MLPQTYLLSAPIGARNSFGEPIFSNKLIAGLKELNPMLQTPMPDACGFYPGKEFGMATLWLGLPFAEDSLKVTAFHLAMPDGTPVVPEFSLVDASIFPEEGEADPVDVARTWRKGWRAIFEACIRCRVATRDQIEKKFDVILSNYGAENPACDTCEKNGVKRPATSALSGLCDFHDEIRKAVLGINESREEAIRAGRHHHG